MREGTYREMPEVTFPHRRVIIVAQAVGGREDDGEHDIDEDDDEDVDTERTELGDHEIFYSTVGPVNELRDGPEGTLRMASVFSRAVDDNLDGKAERFELTAELPLLEGERVYSLQVSGNSVSLAALAAGAGTYLQCID